MKDLKLGIACDHAGFALKQTVIAWLKEQGIEVTDYGCPSTESCDYPDFAHPMAASVEDGTNDMGIAICSTGNGITMTCNHHQGIRAALCWDEPLARLARQHNIKQQMLNLRPIFNDWGWTYNNPALDEDTENLKAALELMLKADGKGAAYTFDVTNIARQYLTNLFNISFREYEVAVKEGKLDVMKEKADLMLKILDDLDEIVGTQEYFLMGKWIADARSWGTTPEEKDFYEREARNIVTTWAGKAHQSLNDYARRSCNGLISSYYKPRWERFFNVVGETMAAGKGFHIEQYHVYKDEITDFEMDWWQNNVGSFTAEPVGESRAVVQEIIADYL